jgi:hypothetical protein
VTVLAPVVDVTAHPRFEDRLRDGDTQQALLRWFEAPNRSMKTAKASSSGVSTTICWRTCAVAVLGTSPAPLSTFRWWDTAGRLTGNASASSPTARGRSARLSSQGLLKPSDARGRTTVPPLSLRVDTAVMGGCCDADGYDGMFGARFSRHVAKRYRKWGLDKSATPRVGFLAEQCVQGACVLEIGGGVGHIRLEPLRRGGGPATSPGLTASPEA